MQITENEPKQVYIFKIVISILQKLVFLFTSGKK